MITIEQLQDNVPSELIAMYNNACSMEVSDTVTEEIRDRHIEVIRAEMLSHVTKHTNTLMQDVAYVVRPFSQLQRQTALVEININRMKSDQLERLVRLVRKNAEYISEIISGGWEPREVPTQVQTAIDELRYSVSYGTVGDRVKDHHLVQTKAAARILVDKVYEWKNGQLNKDSRDPVWDQLVEDGVVYDDSEAQKQISHEAYLDHGGPDFEPDDSVTLPKPGLGPR